jgi:hypothetical protein
VALTRVAADLQLPQQTSQQAHQGGHQNPMAIGEASARVRDRAWLNLMASVLNLEASGLADAPATRREARSHWATGQAAKR